MFLNWKKRYFKKKYRGVEKMIEDLFFKRFKTLEIREEIRQEYDNLKSRLAILESQIKKANKKDKSGLKDKEILLKRDIDRIEKQIEGLDLEINGCKPTAEYQNGIVGINNQLDSLHELKGMIKNYIREL